MEWVLWVLLAIVGVVVLGYIVSRLLKLEATTRELAAAQAARTATIRPPPTPSRRGPSRLSVADMLVRVRELRARTGQWPEIWSVLNPSGDPTVQQMLIDLRNDGLQFAPSDGLRRIELACEELAATPNADAAAVLKKVLGNTDILDRFR
jgi:hypothetical protein